MIEEQIWVEKYRPRTINELALCSKQRELLQGIIEKDNIPNMTFYSTIAGAGKTTIAKIIPLLLNRETLFINGSKENGIDTLRNKMQDFVLYKSNNGKKKVIIIDEGDGLSKTTMQPALRGFIEEHHNNCSFIITCNYINNIIDPILSRCVPIDFTYAPEEKNKLAKNFRTVVYNILDKEHVEYDKKVVTEILKDTFPDFRKCIGTLQSIYTAKNSIKEYSKDTDVSKYELILEHIKSSNYKLIKEWVKDNFKFADVYSNLYNTLYNNCSSDMKLQLILILSKYENRGQVGDKEISLLACLTEIFMNWKED